MDYTHIKKKVVGGLLAVMLLTSALPVPAQGATLEELQAQIQVLLAQINALNSGLQNNTGAVCSPFVSDLTIGRSGTDVSRLQNFLISKGLSIPAGATGYFGVQTQSALASFQSQHAIVPAVGYFGPVTRAKVNALCVQTPTVPVTPSPDDSDDEEPVDTELRGGEAIINRFESKSGDDSNLKESQKNASVMDVSFEVEDGDVRINRVDVAFTPDVSNDEKDPWDTFDEVTLWHDGDRIGRVDASNENNWTEDEPNSGDYRLRFSGLDWIIREDTSVEVNIGISTARSIKGANDGEVWSTFIPDNGIRGIDAERVNIFTGDSGDGVTFDIDEEGSDDELIVKRSNDDEDATTLQLQSNSRSSWQTVFAFDIDTDDSDNDIEIRRLPIELTVSSSTVGTFMRNARITVDGKTYTKNSVTDGVTNTILFQFNRNELVIDAGDRVTVEVEVEFNPLQTVFEGTTIQGRVDTSGIVAKGADDLEGNQISGAARGELHTMRTSGAILKSQSTTAVLDPNSNSTSEDDEGSYSVKFDVTAFNRDIFIAKSALRGTTLGASGVNFIVEDTSLGGVETASGTVAAVLSSNARSEGNYYKVSEGQTNNFTLLVEYNPEYQSFYNVQLHSLNWSTGQTDPTAQQLALPESSFETTPLSISN